MIHAGDPERPGRRVQRAGMYRIIDRTGGVLGGPFRYVAGSKFGPTPDKGCRWQRVADLDEGDNTLF